MIPRIKESVESTLETYPLQIRRRIRQLRKLIYTTASRLDTVGDIEETLKWGEPAYLTSQSRSGTTIRLAWKEAEPTRFRMLFHCQTSLVDTFRTLHPELQYEGNRAIVFELENELPAEMVGHCIELALTYHLWKRPRKVRLSSRR